MRTTKALFLNVAVKVLGPQVLVADRQPAADEPRLFLLRQFQNELDLLDRQRGAVVVEVDLQPHVLLAVDAIVVVILEVHGRDAGGEPALGVEPVDAEVTAQALLFQSDDEVVILVQVHFAVVLAEDR
jgi:hypothetical protein